MTKKYRLYGACKCFFIYSTVKLPRGDCSGDFSGAGGHYNPDHQLHPDHGGDLLPLLGSQGYAWGAFYDKRFQVQDILGRSVVIHRDRDDFTGQPSGGSGERIGCGVIYPGG